jgi:riboflavin synthase
MFTGIVTALGRVARVAPVKRAAGNGDQGAGLALHIRAPLKGLKRGESIAVNGACLTVERVLRDGFTAHVVGTTLVRTLFGEYAVGHRVNLERAVRAGDRMGGHWVQGHVDGIATVAGGGQRGDAWVYDLRVPPPVRDVTVLHGSITVDGVSLTVNTLREADVVEISLVPFTREYTTLGGLAAGDRVHVEGDVLGKYVKALCRSAP